MPLKTAKNHKQLFQSNQQINFANPFLWLSLSPIYNKKCIYKRKFEQISPITSNWSQLFGSYRRQRFEVNLLIFSFISGLHFIFCKKTFSEPHLTKLRSLNRINQKKTSDLRNGFAFWMIYMSFRKLSVNRALLTSACIITLILKNKTIQ